MNNYVNNTKFLWRDQAQFDRKFEEYRALYGRGDVTMTFGEYYARQPATLEDYKEQVAFDKLIDDEIERITENMIYQPK